jgi:hypothetical protein
LWSLIFWASSVWTIFCAPIFCHSFMNCGLRHFGKYVMQLSYRPASIFTNLSFNYLKKVVRDHGWHIGPLFVVNISPPFRQFTAPLRHILPIHNVTINSNNLFLNFRWTFTYCVKIPYDGTHLAFGGILDRCCHFKRVSLKQSWFYHCQTSTTHR